MGLLLAWSLFYGPAGAGAQAPPRSAFLARGPHLERFETDGLKSVMVVPSRRYQAGGLKSFLLGDQYRDLWNTPIRVDVLDLKTFAGGLTVDRAGGGSQSLTLHMRGADGRSYVFRTIDKELTVPVGFENTFAESFMQDMKVKAFHPGAAMVVAPLMDAVGLLHAEPVMVVMPHDSALGEFNEVYGGLFGMIEERPNEEAGDAPGFGGSRKIVKTETLRDRLEESPEQRLDQLDYLKARLMDVLIGDRSRHDDQWRWARYDDDDGSGFVWRPIPRDRDEAFVANDGLLWSVLRLKSSRFQRFRAEYGNVLGITKSAWRLDREFLSKLDAGDWESVAGSIQATLSDGVIEDAVRHMPPELYEIDGAALTEALKRRRDGLAAQAAKFYRNLAKATDVLATDEDERAVIRHRPDGSVEVSLYAAGEDGTKASQPFYFRRFIPDETQEVRVYLRGGDDQALVMGGSGRIRVRVIGGGGDDLLADSTLIGGSATNFYDYRGDNEFVRAADTRVDTREFKRTRSDGTANPSIFDWGSDRDPEPLVDFDGDVGLVLGWGFSDTKFGFRKAPYERRFLARVGAASSGRVRLDLEADFIDVMPGVDFELSAGFSGVQGARFHGFGNSTEISQPSEFYEVKRYDFWAEPALRIEPVSGAVLSTGPILRITSTSAEGPALINRERPYGLGGDFWEAGWRVAFDFDKRDSRMWPTKGSRLSVEARAFPAVLDAEESFAGLSALASTYLSTSIFTPMTLALRVGGEQTWGRTPYHEAAYLGGHGSLRGFRRDRFVGDASLFAGADLRITIGHATLLTFPSEWGVLGLSDVGRVYLEGEDSDQWHSAFGGGVWIAPLGRRVTFSLSLARSEEETRVYGGLGFSF